MMNEQKVRLPEITNVLQVFSTWDQAPSVKVKKKNCLTSKGLNCSYYWTNTY